jgi:hypothetical protein
MFFNQGSASSPFVVFVYGSEEAKTILGKCQGVEFEDGLETLLYPSRAYPEFRDMHRRDTRPRSASPQRRRGSSPPDQGRRSRLPIRVHIVDVKNMVRSMSKIHEESPALRKDADRFGVKYFSERGANSATDARSAITVI